LTRRRLLIGVAVAYVAALLLAPVIELLWSAFALGIRPFLRAITAPDAVHALEMTALMTVVAVVFNGVFGTAIAFVLVRDPRFVGRRLLNGLVEVPFAVSPVIAGFVLIELFGRRGVLGPLLDAHHLKIAFAWPGMAIATTFVSLPFVVREVAPVLEEIGVDQELAARTLGASELTTFLRVTLPSIRWGLFYGVTLTAARAIGEFGAVLVVSGGVAGQTETATSFIYRALEDRNDVGGAAVSLVLAIASIALLLGMDALKRRRAGVAGGEA
jgi:sulfate transport system permease protein